MSSSQYQNGRKNDTVYWIVAIVFLITGFAAPIGFLMIVLKLLGGNKRKRGRHPYYMQQDASYAAPMGARTTAAAAEEDAAAAPKKKKQSKRKKTVDPAQQVVLDLTAKGKRLASIGGAATAICALITLLSASDALFWLPEYPMWFLEEVVPPLCFTAAGAGVLWAGLRRRKQANLYRNYLAMIGRRESVSVSSLASATGRSPSKIRDDLADMLEDGMFPSGYLDYGNDRLVLSGEGLSDSDKPAQEEPQQPKEDKTGEDDLLSELRSVSAAIDNPKLSSQVDRIGIVTAKILEYQKSHPAKATQLHSFLSYYLPTTLKILRAYSQLEDQEVSGENISSAMERIEGMMDQVVEGFEKQLDLLFQGDAMDITTDVEVLERMLAKDGLSDRDGITLEL